MAFSCSSFLAQYLASSSGMSAAHNTQHDNLHCTQNVGHYKHISFMLISIMLYVLYNTLICYIDFYKLLDKGQTVSMMIISNSKIQQLQWKC